MMKTDIAHIYNKVSCTALMMLCLVSFFSCVKADLCSEESHAHTGNVKIVYHWEDVEELRPDSMLVLVNRTVCPHHMGYVTDAVSSVGGRYSFGAIDTATNDALVVDAGKYQVIAFNNDVVDAGKGDVKDYDFVNLNEFGDGQHLDCVSINDLGIAYVVRELSDERLELYGKDWQNTNPYSKYVATDCKPIYLATSKKDGDVYEQIYDVKAGQELTVNLYPRKITQDITFSLPIYTEKGQVAIDSVIAEISGIPQKMMLYSGALDLDNTCKMLFKLVLNEDVAPQDEVFSLDGEDKELTKLEYASTISVMGLVRNKDPKDCTGAGILQLCIYASTIDANGEKESMIPQYARINLFNTIYSAKLTVQDQLGEFYKQNPELESNVALRIDSSLVVLHDGYRTISSGDNSKDSWTIIP